MSLKECWDGIGDLYGRAQGACGGLLLYVCFGALERVK